MVRQKSSVGVFMMRKEAYTELSVQRNGFSFITKHVYRSGQRHYEMCQPNGAVINCLHCALSPLALVA